MLKEIHQEGQQEKTKNENRINIESGGAGERGLRQQTRVTFDAGGRLLRGCRQMVPHAPKGTMGTRESGKERGDRNDGEQRREKERDIMSELCLNYV